MGESACIHSVATTDRAGEPVEWLIETGSTPNSLTEDRTRLVVDVVLEDPVYLAEPFSGQLQWEYSPNLELHRYNCDPEISRIFTQR
jgi:hypothetical protein